MRIKITKLNDQENELVQGLTESMNLIQKDIDELMVKHQELKKPLEELKSKIRAKRELMSPLGQMKAAICSAESRDKYFPEETKASLLEKAKAYSKTT